MRGDILHRIFGDLLQRIDDLLNFPRILDLCDLVLTRPGPRRKRHSLKDGNALQLAERRHRNRRGRLHRDERATSLDRHRRLGSRRIESAFERGAGHRHGRAGSASVRHGRCCIFFVGPTPVALRNLLRMQEQVRGSPFCSLVPSVVLGGLLVDARLGVGA